MKMNSKSPLLKKGYDPKNVERNVVKMYDITSKKKSFIRYNEIR